MGRTTEITRDELKFTKFVQRLRSKFSTMFDDLLRVQLVLKMVCTEEEWQIFKEDIWYDFKKDNNFNELKEAELLTNRVSILQLVDPYVGRYYSMEWVRKNVLHLTDEDIQEIDAQIQAETPPTPLDQFGNPLPTDQFGNPLPPMPPQQPGMAPPQPQQQPPLAPPVATVPQRGQNQQQQPKQENKKPTGKKKKQGQQQPQVMIADDTTTGT